MKKTIMKRIEAVITCITVCFSMLLLFPFSQYLNSMAYDSSTAAALDKACAWAEAICNDDSHGYSAQWSIDGPDYACTTLIAAAFDYAGIPFTDWYRCDTWDSILPDYGFNRVDYDTRSSAELEKGDIIWNGEHVELYIGNNQLAGANSARKHPEQGDQTGDEVYVKNYYSNGWICAFRLGGGGHDCYDYELDIPYCRPSGSPLIQKGSKGHYVGWVQTALERLGYDVGGVDCDFGGNTDSAVKAYQSDKGLEVDGQVGPDTINAIVNDLRPIPPDPDGPILSEGAGQTLPDGDYYIYSNLKLNYYLDIDGAAVPAVAGTNVHMWTASRLPTSADAVDAWTLKYLGNGFYKIMQKGTNLCLDVQGGSQKRGTNVQVWTEHDDTPEQWSIAATDTGYTIRARCGGYYLDMYNAETADGTNVQLWDLDDGIHQRWGFVPFAPSVGQTIADGIYTIQSAADENYCLDVSGGDASDYRNETNVQLWKTSECNDAFKVKYLSGGYYSICEATSGLALDIVDKGAGGYLNKNNNIQLYTNNVTANQQWIIKDAGDGNYNIISAYSGYSIDLDGGVTENGRNVRQHYYNTSNAQKWKFVTPMEAPQSATLQADKKSAIVGEAITFTADSDTATAYWIGIDKDGERIITEEMKDGTLTVSFDEAGEYTAYVTASNAMGGKDSERITFNIKPYEISLYETEKHTIAISGSDLTYKSSNKDVAVVSTKGVITAMGKGNAIITASDTNGKQILILVQVLSERIMGDCNADGQFNISDVVTLQKWLITDHSSEMKLWKNADFVGDNRLDVFDLVLMRRAIIYK